MSRVLLPVTSWCASLALHLALLAMGNHVRPSLRGPVAPAVVQLELAAPEPEPPEPRPPAAPEPPREEAKLSTQPAAPLLAGARVPAPPPPSPVAPAPVSPSPEQLGATLGSDDTSPGSAPAGSGAERNEPGETSPAGALPSARQSPSAPAPRPRAAAPAPATVPLTELSRKPSPPSLTEALERHYPRDARRLGRSGAASVRARIAESGVVSEARLKDETEPGFGAACQRALLGSRWSPPLDRRGLPVATWVSYRCKFRSQ